MLDSDITSYAYHICGPLLLWYNMVLTAIFRILTAFTIIHNISILYSINKRRVANIRICGTTRLTMGATALYSFYFVVVRVDMPDHTLLYKVCHFTGLPEYDIIMIVPFACLTLQLEHGQRHIYPRPATSSSAILRHLSYFAPGTPYHFMYIIRIYAVYEYLMLRVRSKKEVCFTPRGNSVLFCITLQLAVHFYVRVLAFFAMMIIPVLQQVPATCILH